MTAQNFFDPIMLENATNAIRQTASQCVDPQAASSQEGNYIYTVYSHLTFFTLNYSESAHEMTFSNLDQANDAAVTFAREQLNLDEDLDESHDFEKIWHGENGKVRIVRASICLDQQISCFVGRCEIEYESEHDDMNDDKAGEDMQMEVDDSH
ncbi:MAG: hypothetical protein L6R41_000207 [Letrouitia leprolyta]|nr:MAG: hypothetical protein L6R41_000207 [Letrouitia leprolyta]